MRASRLLSILMILQARGHRTASQLAAELEVSQRTIHRDIDELSASGVPVYADRGRSGGFRLMDGYQTKLTGLDSDEASVLMLSGIGRALDDLGLSGKLSQTERKLLAALPEAARTKANTVADRFYLDPLDWYRVQEKAPFVSQIAHAVWTDQRISISYLSWKGRVQRDLDPLAIVLKAGVWYMVCRAKNIRVYRISSVERFELKGEEFERPSDFDVDVFWKNWIAEFEQKIRSDHARLRVSARGLRLMDNIGLKMIEKSSIKNNPDMFEVKLAVEDEVGAVRELLSFGVEVEVVEPISLRVAMKQEITKMQKLYSNKS